MNLFNTIYQLVSEYFPDHQLYYTIIVEEIMAILTYDNYWL